MNTVQQLVQHYNMILHPEGGYYKETYRSNELIHHNALPERFAESCNFSTAIYFLLEKENFSAFHKIKSDECWHFYAGQTLLVHVIDEQGNLTTTKLGADIFKNETFQFVVPANCWFASEPAPETTFSLVGCTVAPGFNFNDFELAKANELIQQYPQHKEIIEKLCR